ncbi:hypothetical protein N7481_005576 [Penicillium waksmanii]|uniref:uncharacterized protein n=1 Tax=Penicillium waksmanii TaxID=69791 RepID=UPI0025487933|nr:uncharacterized protein N7481_005576 [Penicillium waksmanii]KAJ5983477.1 hypothetical protein N7481_005576 [Penicillium waksmanii]
MRSFNIVSSLMLIVSAVAVAPAAIYTGDSSSKDVQLRIALANAFIKSSVKNCSNPFAIEWYKSDTTESINHLKDNTVDIGITYSPAAEQIAIKKGIAKDPAWYTWRNHFLLVGPKSNPAKISHNQNIKSQFSDIYTAAENGTSDLPVRFLTRYDKSATNIKDSSLWLSIGHVPWATKYSPCWRSIPSPTAARTSLSIEEDVASKAVIFKASTDEPPDPLLNPAHILVGKNAKYEKMADRFAEWAIGSEGQKVITGLKRMGSSCTPVRLLTGRRSSKMAV